jgi:hypothetical protein
MHTHSKLMEPTLLAPGMGQQESNGWIRHSSSYLAHSLLLNPEDLANLNSLHGFLLKAVCIFYRNYSVSGMQASVRVSHISQLNLLRYSQISVVSFIRQVMYQVLWYHQSYLTSVIVSECSDFEWHGKGLMYFIMEILRFILPIQFIPMCRTKFVSLRGESG